MAFVVSNQQYVSGMARVKLYKGHAMIVGRKSEHSLYRHELATYEEGDQYDASAAQGFIKIHGLSQTTQAKHQMLKGGGRARLELPSIIPPPPAPSKPITPHDARGGPNCGRPVLDPSEQANVIRRRKESDCDRFDEVWDGVYVVSPNPNLEHQGVGTALATILSIAIDWTGLGHVFQGVNVSDREDDWEKNYRIPDVAVYLQGNPARACVTHWFGGPDLAFEIVSPNDRCREKLPFYANIRTRELMIVDRDPWALELYRLQGDTFVLIGTSDLANRPSWPVRPCR